MNMSDEDNEKGRHEIQKHTDHLANERTFLSWIRTSIEIMVFGFAIQRLTMSSSVANKNYSLILSVVLLILGVFLCILAFIKYKKVEHQIKHNIFETSLVLDMMLTVAIFLIGVFLAIVLLNNH